MSQTSALSVKNSLRRVQVALPLGLDRAYDYLVPDGMNISLGDYVTVPFGRRTETGIVWSAGADDSVPAEKIKEIAAVLEAPGLSDTHRRFIERVAKYTLSDLGAVLKMSLSAPQALKPPKGKRRIEHFPGDGINGDLPPLHFSAEQATAAERLTRAVVAQEFSVSLLDGVTGSGKTEVYFDAIAACIRQKKQALVLLPEIALSAQFKTRFLKRFGAEPAIWHSEITPAQRRQIWLGAAGGHSRVVIGARSALFLPFKNLGLMIVDEEHDPSYKQDDGVAYHARDMTILRAQTENIPAILVSATPSLETMMHAQSGKYQHITLPERHGGAAMPEVSVIDLKKSPPPRGKFLSLPMTEALQETLAQGEQALLFLNRRGYAPLTLCRACGHRFKCSSCSAWLVEHRKAGKLQCHHCGHQAPMPKSCPSCAQTDTLAACGPGVERIEEEVKSILPDARVLVLASDTVTTPGMIADAIDSVEKGDVDIIIGTQMVAKGHHFPNLTLVGIVDADIGLDGGDLRAAERCFQILHQVSGRAGREKKQGRVILQTYMPQQPVMRALLAGDRDAFLSAESKDREKSAMPPFGRLAGVIISAIDENILDHFCRDLLKRAPRYDDIRVLGPAPAPISFLRGRHRRRFLVKTGKNVNIQKYLQEWLDGFKIPSQVQLKIDIDPQNFF
jgi:primosomal protein N' (replication factor Y)